MVVRDPLRNTSFSLIRRISLQTLRKIYLCYLELRLKTFDNVKSVIVWNVSFRLAFCGFKNSGPKGMIFSRSKPVFWGSSSLENCNTYKLTLINIKQSTESKTQTGFNSTTTPGQNTFLLRTNVDGLYRHACQESCVYHHSKQSLSCLYCF